GIHPKGDRLAVPARKTGGPAGVVRLSDGERVLDLDDRAGRAFQFAWSADGMEIVASGTEVVVLDGSTGSLKWRVPGLRPSQYYTIGTSRHGLLCIVGAHVEVWDLLARQRVWTTRGDDASTADHAAWRRQG